MLRKVFVPLFFVLALILSACGPSQAEFDAMKTQVAAVVTPTLSVEQLQATISALTTPQAAVTPAPTGTGVAPAASATPQSASATPEAGYALATFCYPADKLGVAFPRNKETAYAMFVGKSVGDTVTRADDMTPLLTDGANLLYGWTYGRHGSSSEPVITVTNPTLFVQNGWIQDPDLRKLYGYTSLEAQILETGRDVTGAGIPGLAMNVRVEGFTFFCAPPSAETGAVKPGHQLVNERSTAYLIQQLPLP